MEGLGQFITILLIIMAVCVGIALLGLVLIARQIRAIRVPHDADFFTTMRYVPLALVVLLDLLDFGLDIFSAPIAWIVLDRMGLPNLRNKATLEALIPITNVIPTFTVAWFVARLLNLGDPPGHYDYPAPRQLRRPIDEFDPYPRPERRRRTIDMDDR